MKRVLSYVLVGLVVLGVLAYLFRRPLTMAVVRTVAGRNMQASLVEQLPDGLHVALCGAGSPLADPQRSGPCVAVVAGTKLYVIDSGSGASRNLTRMRFPQGRIDAVLLTHFHSDHIDGLGELLLQSWVNGTRKTPTPVIGPSGVEEIVEGFGRAYRRDAAYRVAHHGEDIVPPGGSGGLAKPFALPGPGESVEVVKDGDLAIIAFAVDHAPVEPAVGYRFDYKDRSVTISGDTRKSKNLEKFAQGTDLLVHEALSPELVGGLTEAAKSAGRDNLVKITADILDYHTSPREAAQVAHGAGAGALLLYHIVPPLLVPTMHGIFLEGVADAYDGPVTIGTDGTLVHLPAGAETIEVEELL